MFESNTIAASETIVDAMVELTLAGASQRLIAAGSGALVISRDLRRRRFSRISTTRNCRIAGTQHDVAMVAGERTFQGLEAEVLRVTPFLASHAAIAIWVDYAGLRCGKKIQVLLERLGFRVECGAKCETGFVLAARRHECIDLAKVARGL
jgi:hypothetical protein